MKALNRIFFGSPGTGKTYGAIREALQILSARPIVHAEQAKLFRHFLAEGRLAFTVFHPGWTYEGFVEDREGRAGVFKRFCKNAAASNEPYIFLIDEIDRADVAAVFGELVTLLEEERRIGSAEESPAVLAHSGELFSIPANVYIIATMNSAEKGSGGVDAALRRRFSFSSFHTDASVLKGIFVHAVAIDEMLAAINERIDALLDSRDGIGQAYFMRLKDSPNQEEVLADIFRSHVIPQLFDSCEGNWEIVRKILNHQFVTENTIKLPDNYKIIYYIDEQSYYRAETYRKLVDINK